MAPARPIPPSSGVLPRRDSAPTIFGGRRRPGRIEKKTAPSDELKKKHQRQVKGQTPPEAEAEAVEQAMVQQESPEPESTAAQSPRRPKPRASLAAATPAGDVDSNLDDGEDNCAGAVSYHTISTGGPKLKTIGELLLEADSQQNFRIPASKIIANEEIDERVREQMRRVTRGGDLTVTGVRKFLARSAMDCLCLWDHRQKRSCSKFWSLVRDASNWAEKLDAGDCRKFILSLCAYYRNGSGRSPKTEMAKAFENLDQLFRREENSELDKYINACPGLQPAANRLLGRGRGRGADGPRVSQKKTKETGLINGNIFTGSAITNTNMNPDEVAGVDKKALKPIWEVGPLGRELDAQQRKLPDLLSAEKEAEAEAAAAAAISPAPLPRPTQARNRGPVPRGEGLTENMRGEKIRKSHVPKGGPRSD